MKFHSFIGNFDLSKKELIVEDKDFVNQAKNVLRLKVGDKLILGNGNLNEAIAEIFNLNKKFAGVKILEVHKNQNEPGKYIVLHCPILKKENLELAIQKAVEIGVKEITPIITGRTVKLGLNHERLNKIIKEAAEQSGRGILPKLNEVITFEKAVEEAKTGNDLNLFFDITGQPFGHSMSKSGKIGIFVGPEGGWDDKEIKIAKNAGFTFVSLSKTTLRAETAAIVGSWAIINL